MKKPFKKLHVFRGPQKSCFWVFWGGLCSNLSPKIRFWADLRFSWGPEMALEISPGAPKVGQRSSSLSWTVQINQTGSRPGADLGAIWLQGHIFLDLGPFLVDFGSVFGWFLQGFSMNFGTNFGRKFNDFSHMFGKISLTYFKHIH